MFRPKSHLNHPSIFMSWIFVLPTIVPNGYPSVTPSRGNHSEWKELLSFTRKSVCGTAAVCRLSCH